MHVSHLAEAAIPAPASCLLDGSLEFAQRYGLLSDVGLRLRQWRCFPSSLQKWGEQGCSREPRQVYLEPKLPRAEPTELRRCLHAVLMSPAPRIPTFRLLHPVQS